MPRTYTEDVALTDLILVFVSFDFILVNYKHLKKKLFIVCSVKIFIYKF